MPSHAISFHCRNVDVITLMFQLEIAESISPLATSTPYSKTKTVKGKRAKPSLVVPSTTDLNDLKVKQLDQYLKDRGLTAEPGDRKKEKVKLCQDAQDINLSTNPDHVEDEETIRKYIGEKLHTITGEFDYSALLLGLDRDSILSKILVRSYSFFDCRWQPTLDISIILIGYLMWHLLLTITEFFCLDVCLTASVMLTRTHFVLYMLKPNCLFSVVPSL